MSGSNDCHFIDVSGTREMFAQESVRCDSY